jgi:hypothetical protein
VVAYLARSRLIHQARLQAPIRRASRLAEINLIRIIRDGDSFAVRHVRQGPRSAVLRRRRTLVRCVVRVAARRHFACVWHTVCSIVSIDPRADVVPVLREEPGCGEPCVGIRIRGQDEIWTTLLLQLGRVARDVIGAARCTVNGTRGCGTGAAEYAEFRHVDDLVVLNAVLACGERGQDARVCEVQELVQSCGFLGVLAGESRSRGGLRSTVAEELL